jgi:hypothetical protein
MFLPRGTVRNGHAIRKTYEYKAFEDGPDRGFRNVGQYKPDAGGYTQKLKQLIIIKKLVRGERCDSIVLLAVLLSRSAMTFTTKLQKKQINMPLYHKQKLGQWITTGKTQMRKKSKPRLEF